MGHFVLCAGRKSIKMLSKRAVGALRQYVQISHRSLSTSAARTSDAIIFTGPEDKSEIYPKIGNRDIVGHGMNGKPCYMDALHYPCPAVRFKENTADVLALREKELGDWKALSIDEKKALYRASFRSTFSEIQAPSGQWKIIVTLGFITFSIALGIQLIIREIAFGQDQLPRSLKDPQWKEATLERMVRGKMGHLKGPAAHFDYEKGDWK